MPLPADCCCVCGSPALPSPPSQHAAWLSRVRAVVDSGDGYLTYVSEPGRYVHGGRVVDPRTGEQFPVNWSAYHSVPASTRAHGIPRPEFAVHDGCWRLVADALSEQQLRYVPRFFLGVWASAHEAWTYHRRPGRATSVRQYVSTPGFDDALAGLAGARRAADAPRVPGGAGEYVALLGGVQRHWLGLAQEYPQAFLADPHAVPRLVRRCAPAPASSADAAHAAAAACTSAADTAPGGAAADGGGRPEGAQHAAVPQVAPLLAELPVEVLEQLCLRLDARSFAALCCATVHVARAPFSPRYWRAAAARGWPTLGWGAVPEAAADAAAASHAGAGAHGSPADGGGGADAGGAAAENAGDAAGDAGDGSVADGAPACRVRVADTDIDWRASYYAVANSGAGRNALRVVRLVAHIKREVAVPLRWDHDALRRVRGLPPCFRQRVHEMVEAFARTNDIARITSSVYHDAAEAGNVIGILTGAAA